MPTLQYSESVRAAKVLWDYFVSIREEVPSQAIVVCCSYDLRVIEYAAGLLKHGLSDTIVISGNRGNWTGRLWDQPESEIFYEHCKEELDEYNVVIENQSRNFSENIENSVRLLEIPGNILFVTKPNSLYRIRLTVPKIYPKLKFAVSSPYYDFPGGVSNVIGLVGLINEMVGDVDRILNYPDRGFQVPHALPEHVSDSWEFLVAKGFTEHMLR